MKTTKNDTVHIIQSGECIDSIAFSYGVTADMIWDHENNAQLRKTRQRRDVLLFGDQVFIPKVRPKTERVSTQQSTLFIANRPLRSVRLRLVRDPQTIPSPPTMLKPNEYDNPPSLAPKAEPWAEVDVQIVGEGFTWTGKTDADGKLSAEVPMNVCTALLIAATETEDERRFELQFGKLDPVDTPSGIAHGSRTEATAPRSPKS